MSDRTCLDCGAHPKPLTRGLCRTCYSRWRDRGIEMPPKVRRPFATFEVRFAEASAGRAPEECWPWPGPLNRQGYPSGRTHGRSPHQRAWEAANGPIPENMQVDHRCHSEERSCRKGRLCPHRRCVNPSHLRILTAKQNSQLRTDLAVLACTKGHPRTEEYGYVRPRGTWRCRVCHREYNAALKRKKSSAKRPRAAAALTVLSPSALSTCDDLQRAAEKFAAARTELEDAARAALSLGLPPEAVIKLSGYSRQKLAALKGGAHKGSPAA